MEIALLVALCWFLAGLFSSEKSEVKTPNAQMEAEKILIDLERQEMELAAQKMKVRRMLDKGLL